MNRRSKTIAGAAITLLAMAILAAGCGSSPAPQVQPAPAGSAGSASVPASSPMSPVAVADALKFTATTIDGRPFDAAELAGKPAVLWFWAAWCPRCRAKSGDVTAVSRDFIGKVNVVGVAGLGSGDAAMAKFAADTGITAFPNLADDKGEVWKKFGVTSQEYFVLIDKSGTVVHKGPLSGTDLRQRVTALAG